MGRMYRDRVIQAREGLRHEDRRAEAVTALRAMVEKIVLTPNNGVLEIELEGALAGMLAAASPKAEAEDLQRTVKLVAGAGFEPATFGL